MAEDENQAEHRREEALKLFFEYFKHTTTLGTAAALVILAVYKPDELRSSPGSAASPAEVFDAAATSTAVGQALAALGFALLFSLIGMTAAALRFDLPAEAVHKWLRRLVYLVAFSTGIAVWSFMGAAFGPGMRYLLSISLLIFIVVHFARKGDLRFLMPRLPRTKGKWSGAVTMWLKIVPILLVAAFILVAISLALAVLF